MPEPGTIDATQLTRLSGLGERRLRELTEEGWLPAPERGRYALVPVNDFPQRETKLSRSR